MRLATFAAAAVAVASAPAIGQVAPLVALSAPNPEGEPQGRLVIDFIDAVNRGDRAGAARLIADDMKMPKRWTSCAIDDGNKACLLKQIEEVIWSPGGTAQRQKMAVQRQIVRVNMAISSPTIREEGAERILVTDEFVVEKGQIRSYIRTPRTEDEQTRRYYFPRHLER